MCEGSNKTTRFLALNRADLYEMPSSRLVYGCVGHGRGVVEKYIGTQDYVQKEENTIALALYLSMGYSDCRMGIHAQT